MTISSISESTRSHRSNSTSKSSVIMSKENATREKQREFAMSTLNRELNLGDKWYLLNKDWFQRWSAYIGLESSEKVSEIPPEKISNRRLLIETDSKSIGSPAGKRVPRLREDIVENADYVTVPQELWNYLVNIYSLESDDDVIEREVIDDSVDGDSGLPNLRIEIRRLQVHMECSYNKSQPSTHIEELSRQTKIETIIEMMKRLFNVPGDKPVRLYFRSAPTQCSASCAAGSPAASATATASNTSMTQVDVKENSTLMTTSYAPDDTIVMCVVSNEDASKPIPPAPALPTSSSPQPPSYTATRYMTTRNQSFNNGLSSSTSASAAAAVNVERRGLCGLSNLGNTCFMNSALQCMSNVPPLTDYFWNQTYKSEINKVNPLGRQGEIAEAYASLIADMWSGNNSYVIPRQFKLALSKFAPQFTGYQQQDSQELLAFLLDGLHEDLNRVLKKPYVELGSHVGKTDEEFAKQSWQDHLKRNDSIIVDIFHGLLKSTLNCLVCKEISIKFDPFCYLSVPLPSKKERLIEVFFVPIDPSQLLLKCKLTVLKNGTMQDLCASMESLLEKDSSILNKVPRSRMIVCDVYSNKFFKIYEPNESVTNIRERDDIYIYELQSSYSNPDFLRIKLHLREKTSSHTSSSCFGLPLFFMVPKENLTYGSLYQLTLKYLRRFLKSSTNTSEEINSKLNNSLNVKDEESIASIDQDAEATNGGGDNSNLSEEEMSDGTTTRLASKLAAKPFSLHVSKSDNIDYDSNFASQQNINDDTPFEWPAPVTTSSYSFNSSSSSSSQSQIVSLCADFTTASLRRNYKKSKMTVADSNLNSELVVEHSSCQTTQLSKQRKDVISLADCFSLYTKTEDLSSQDYWYCSKCKAHQASTKKFDLWKLPPVLVVHLKRFSYDRMYRDKIDTLVDFPLSDLDMAPYLINKNAGNTRYNLIAVSNHYGSLGGGHYTAYGKNRCDGKWYYFDDSSVSSAEETSVCTPAAYMLIYLRKDLDDMSKNGLGTLNDDTHNKSNSDRMDY